MHTVTQADIAARSISNTAQAIGDVGVLALSTNSNTVVITAGTIFEIPRAGAEIQDQILWTACVLAVGLAFVVIGKRRRPSRHIGASGL